MKKEFSGFQLLLAHWIKGDTLLWKNLEDGHIKLLYERLVKELPFEKLATKHKYTIQQIRQVFEAVLAMVERSHGDKIAEFLRELSDAIETGQHGFLIGQGGFEFQKIWLN